MKKCLSLCIILLACMTSYVYAMKMNTLYQAHLFVHSQTTEERDQNLSKALEQVLIKVTGNSQILTNSFLTAHLTLSESLMQEFSYSQNPGNTSLNNAPYILNIQFDPESINQLLRNAGAPVWGPERPLVVAWVKLNTLAGTEIISQDSGPALLASLKNQAERRGLPLILPLMDAIDLSNISQDSITQKNNSALEKATQRYDTTLSLIGNITENPNHALDSQWRLLIETDQWDWALSGKTFDEIAANIIDKISDTIATRYAIITSNQIQKNIVLKIANIHQQTDFTHLMQYLQHLPSIAEVTLLRVDNNEVWLNLSLRTSLPIFMQSIAAGQRLIPIPSQQSSELAYQWGL